MSITFSDRAPTPPEKVAHPSKECACPVLFNILEKWNHKVKAKMGVNDYEWPRLGFPDPGDQRDDRDCPEFNPFGSPPISPLACSGSRAFPGHGHSGDSFGGTIPGHKGTLYRRALRVITEFVVTDIRRDAYFGDGLGHKWRNICVRSHGPLNGERKTFKLCNL